MVQNILQIGDNRLTKKSKKITDFASKKLHKLVKDLIDTCEADRETTAGLAAPQIGENVRVSVIRRVDKEPEDEERAKKIKWEALINPEIIEIDEKSEVLLWEACLSIGVGKDQIWGPVWRPDYVKIRYQNVLGERKTIEAHGYLSHIIQHEIDHLDGKLFISHVKNPDKNLWRSIDLDDYISKNDRYPQEI